MSGTDQANGAGDLAQRIERTRDALAPAEEAARVAGAAVIRLDETRAQKPWLLPAVGAAAGLAVAGAVFALLRRRGR